MDKKDDKEPFLRIVSIDIDNVLGCKVRVIGWYWTCADCGYVYDCGCNTICPKCSSNKIIGDAINEGEFQELKDCGFKYELVEKKRIEKKIKNKETLEKVKEILPKIIEEMFKHDQLFLDLFSAIETPNEQTKLAREAFADITDEIDDKTNIIYFDTSHIILDLDFSSDIGKEFEVVNLLDQKTPYIDSLGLSNKGYKPNKNILKNEEFKIDEFGIGFGFRYPTILNNLDDQLLTFPIEGHRNVLKLDDDNYEPDTCEKCKNAHRSPIIDKDKIFCIVKNFEEHFEDEENCELFEI